MRCYNCGCELSEHSFCTNCGVDVALYKKIIRTSNYFYNRGLEQARVRDLSGAIVSLRQSLKFNKNNIKARNLLGLVYFEMGEVTAALCEWVISKNLKAKKNMAADYLDMVQSNTAKLDDLNDAIKKYNKALEYCQSEDGIDMAVIQLKGVLKTNPNFVRAHQLLALCYLKAKRPELAKRELDKCKVIDVNNLTTLRYEAEVERLLNPEEEQGGKKRKKKGDEEPASTSYVEGNELIIRPLGIKEKKGSNTVLNILFGIAIGAAAMMLTVFPGRLNHERMKAQDEIKAIANQLDAKNIYASELEQKLSDANEKNATLNETLGAYAGTEGTLQSMENLLKAAAIYLENPESFLEVADYIKEVDEQNWTDDTSENYKRLYAALKTVIGPQVCQSYYDDGFKAYKDGQYEDAIAYFTGAVYFDATHKDALYYLGMAYQSAGKNEDAKLTFNKVVELFPGTWHAQSAEKALKKLEQ
ncbi:MAG: tetratricopeptide repeat protein [Lachnospiraceae bacterium]|nr:tetratricopeptide repeat protein [Lachnospiraceae bacterium]